MANPLYAMLTGQPAPQPAPQPTQPMPAQGILLFQNPMQKMNYIMFMQAMRNPAQFVRQAFPDIPADISNNPSQILQYLQQTRGISNEQIQAGIQQVQQFQQMLR